MTPQDFHQKFRIAPIYIFAGNEEFFKVKGIQKIKKILFPDDSAKFNISEFEAREVDIAEILDELCTLSLFGGDRLVILNRADQFFGLKSTAGASSSSDSKEESGKGKTNRELLLKYLEKPVKGSTLVIDTDTKWGRFKKLSARVDQIGFQIDCTRPYESRIPDWVQQRARLYKKQLSRPTAQLLASEGGDTLLQLENQLKKLITYIGDRREITTKDVEELVGSCSQQSIFKLTDAAASRKPGKALDILKNLIHFGAFEAYIITMLHWQFGRLWKAKKLQDAGMNSQDIAKQLKLSGYFLSGFMKQLDQFSEAKLRRNHRLLLEADLATKSGANPEVVIEQLVVQVCR